MPNGCVISTDYGPMPPLACGLPVRLFDHPLDETEEGGLRNALRAFRTTLRAALTEKVVLLDSTYGQCLLVAALMSLWPKSRQPVLVLFGDMWVQKTKSIVLARRLLLKLADRAIDGYVVQSTDEQVVFPKAWGIDPSKVYVSLFGYSFDDNLITEHPDQQDYIFAGGNPLRDYEPLVEAARRLPQHRFIFATNRLSNHPNLPSNVVAAPVSKERFQELMECARLVITPIQQGMTRAAGQQTYLNAMRLGKLSVVNSKGVLGVRDYIEDGVTGLLVDGTPEDYVRVITWAFDPANDAEIRAICERAQKTVMQRFRYEEYTRGLINAVDQIIAGSRKTTARQLSRQNAVLAKSKT